MKDQKDNKEWNERWQRQIEAWRKECLRLLEEAEALLVLIELAKAQIRRDPPE